MKANLLELDSIAADPGSSVDGDVWYNSVLGKFRGRQNGVVGDLAGVGSGLTAASFAVVLTPPTNEVFGVVSGLSVSPSLTTGFSVVEQGAAVPTGLFYQVQVLSYLSYGFSYCLSIGLDEWWTGPGTLSLAVNYLWS